jgi:tetratricopeptide (TPR) repeat protein
MQTIDTVGREVAGELGFDRLAAWLEHDLAIPEVEGDNYEPARNRLLRSLEMFRAIADLAGQARCCSSLSYVHGRLGQVDEALAWAQQALVITQQIGDQTVEGVTHLALGRLHTLRNEQDLAKKSFDLSIALAEKAGDLRSLAKRHQIAGHSYRAVSRYDEAAQALLRSVEAFGQIGDVANQAESLHSLAAIYLATGDYKQAAEHAEAGLRHARAYGNKQRVGQLLIELGRIQEATGNLTQARTLWQQAATLLHSISPPDEAVALTLLDTQPAD